MLKTNKIDNMKSGSRHEMTREKKKIKSNLIFYFHAFVCKFDSIYFFMGQFLHSRITAEHILCRI